MDDNQENLANSEGISLHTGFPNPSIDQLSQNPKLTLDLNKLLIRSAVSTFLFRVKGYAWADQGIYDGDIAVIDRAMVPRANDLVISLESNDFRLNRLSECLPDDEPWGIVTAIIHQFRRL